MSNYNNEKLIELEHQKAELLEALEKVVMFHNFDLNDDVREKAVSAIKQARGE